MVPAPPEKQRHSRLLVAGFLLAAAAAIAVIAYVQSSRAERRARTAGPAVRTAAVDLGDLRRTVRLAGVISAERFAAILAPQLRGSRSGRGRSFGNVNTSVATVSTATGNTSASASSDSGAADPNGSLLGNAVASNASTANPNTSSLGTKRGTFNRFNTTPAASTSQSSNTSSTSTSSTSGSAANLGSTASSLLGGGGGGGMGGDFMLVLLNVAKPGSLVKKGEVVAEFDRQYMLLRLDDYRATVSQMDSNIKRLKADQAVALEAHNQLLRAAKADLDKALLDLKTISVRSAIEAESFKLSAEEAKARYEQVLKEDKLFRESQRAQLRAAEIDCDQARIELRRAETNANRMIMKAPIDGIVVMQSIHRGGDDAQVQQGDQVWPGQFFMSIVDPTSMVVTASVNQVDSELLRIGMKAVTRLDAYPDISLPSTVIGVGAMTRAGGWRANYMREIPVRLKLNAMDPRVIPDLSASAAIALQAEPQAVIAPLESVFRDHASQPFVFLQSPTGWIRRDVELGLANNTAVAVRSGLQKGDVVALQRP